MEKAQAKSVKEEEDPEPVDEVRLYEEGWKVGLFFIVRISLIGVSSLGEH